MLRLNARRNEEIFTEAVDEALKRVFGATAAEIIYVYLENNYAIKRHEIADKLEFFSQAMKEYLNSGATVVEQQILDSFYTHVSNRREAANFASATLALTH
jgi:hypothetical protein